jgi:CheY-like chemotaxis protein
VPAHILIVDDEAEVREMLGALLRSQGYSTEHATNGAEALDRLRQRRPAAVVLDLLMPGMNGWTFRFEQLDDPRISDIPVICITGIYDRDLVEQRLAVRCLKKPVEIDEFLQTVRYTCTGLTPS